MENFLVDLPDESPEFYRLLDDCWLSTSAGSPSGQSWHTTGCTSPTIGAINAA